MFSKNCDRLIAYKVVTELLNAMVEMARRRGLRSGEHFRVDGTLIQARARNKSLRRKDGWCDSRVPEDWHRQPRSNDAHESSRHPNARLYRESHAAPALPSDLGHMLTDDCHGLVVNEQASLSRGTAERVVAAQMPAEVTHPGQRATVGADKAYDTYGFVKTCRHLGVTPLVPQNTNRSGGSTMDGGTTRHAGYAIGQRRGKCSERRYGPRKLLGPMREVIVPLDTVEQLLKLTMDASNLSRLRTLVQLRSQCA